MKHRHLVHEDFSLAAIDDILERGTLAAWAPLLREIRRDPNGPVAGRVAQVLEHHTMYGTTRAWARFLQVEQIACRRTGPPVELTPGTRPLMIRP